MVEPEPLIEVRGLCKYFPINRGIVFPKKIGEVKAVDGVGFQISRGETLGLVGESGSGKTTLGRTLLRLLEPTAGEIMVEGNDFRSLSGPKLRLMRQRMQMIFQDPYASLNPRMSNRRTHCRAFTNSGRTRSEGDKAARFRTARPRGTAGRVSGTPPA